MPAKILLLDIETAPKIAYVWQFWKEHVHPDKVIQDGYIMSIAWKWLGDEGGVWSQSCADDIGNDYFLCQTLSMLLDRADIVVAHNAKKFDLPTFNARSVIHRIDPPSPYKVIDTLETARKKFKFDNNSLGYLARILGCKPKDLHGKFPGFKLWSECMAGNPWAWAEMVNYNIIDVEILEEVYYILRPWMDNHPNVGALVDDNKERCPKCGSVHLQKRGYSTTNFGKYHRYKCTACGGWSRSRFTVLDKEKRVAILANGGYA